MILGAFSGLLSWQNVSPVVTHDSLASRASPIYCQLVIYFFIDANLFESFFFVVSCIFSFNVAQGKELQLGLPKWMFDECVQIFKIVTLLQFAICFLVAMELQIISHERVQAGAINWLFFNLLCT